MPGVHLVFSLVKGWIRGTLQGSVSPEHVQAYFDEWVYRFNRRHSRSRGLLFHTLLLNAVGGHPVTYQSWRRTGRSGRHHNRLGSHGNYHPPLTWNAPDYLGVLEITRRNARSRGAKMETPIH